MFWIIVAAMAGTFFGLFIGGMMSMASKDSRYEDGYKLGWEHGVNYMKEK